MNHMQISGVWNPQGRPDGNGFQFADGGLGLHYGSDVSTCEDDRYFFAIDGQLFDVPVPHAIRDPGRLDTAYGHFAYLRYDKISREITIGTDRFGFFPIYYAFEGGCLIFGSSLGFVKSKLKQRTPNYEAWEELMLLGEVIGDKTTVKQIKRLSYGTRIDIKNGRMAFSKFWSPEVPEPMGEDAYIRENNRLLGEALALTAANPKHKVVLLSGGEDSRRLAIGAVKQGLAVNFFTQESIYGGKYKAGVDRDLKLASKVAALLGRPHFSAPMPDNKQYLADCNARDLSLGFECIAHEWLLPLARRIEPGALIYDGIVGDITINGHYFKEFPDAVDKFRDVDALTNMICGNRRSDWLDELRRNTETSLADRVRELVSSYPESPHRLTFYYLLNHTRRKISCVSQLFRQHGHSTCYPFLYYPLFLQSLRLDPRRMVTKFYQRECMAAQAPEVLSIPTTREDISNDWLIPRGAKAQNQQDYLLQNSGISNDALDLFPKFRLRYYALHAMSNVSMVPLRKFGWFIPTIARFSSFLEWIDAETD